MSPDGFASFPGLEMTRLRLREYSRFDGERHDEMMLSLLRREWRPKS